MITVEVIVEEVVMVGVGAVWVVAGMLKQEQAEE